MLLKDEAGQGTYLLINLLAYRFTRFCEVHAVLATDGHGWADAMHGRASLPRLSELVARCA